MLDRIGPGYFRYFLCIVVVLFHSTNYIALGEWAVHVFFILSGYWVVKMYKEKYILFKYPVSSFLSSRLLRLLPVFYINVILMIAVICFVKQQSLHEYIRVLNPDVPFVLSHIFILGLCTTGMIIPPSWSLDIEMQFYIIVPALLFVLAKLQNRKIVFLSVFFILFSILYFLHQNLHFPPSIANYLCFFLVGVLLYQTDYHASKKVAALSICIAVFLVALTYIIPHLFENVVQSNKLKVGGILFRIIFDYLLALIIIPFISRNIRNRGGRWDRDLANLSYITYLFHRVTMYPWGYYYGNVSFAERLPSFVVYLIATFIGSLIIYYLVDIPFEKLRKKWVA
ncbi:acyltransferase family protein [Cytophaga hutchinsonii]|uniref:Acyltransferase family protein n=1 Tax=Cytophaga hutchinsonii (strain ATCC 33406 / DSM 1761 / CIP 103989 / NBRC 15051 / NCIMB 9469 / D465) TaxID=269798 RepID=A0A6N4SPD8_CYTH3|nr:acyltransferase [Cytophaga hutchinsonii]ABG58173.1 acyltransferase family protein [Cytophaga hutchinsonii ATCC 33406]SFY02656.1 Peptidoglycan/LPS O-acetylase OafA/YrhL, contains acyltransferase and SGNH-hydrolase domains [Cytophaga hutchinsonii ATCC 33406]